MKAIASNRYSKDKISTHNKQEYNCITDTNEECYADLTYDNMERDKNTLHSILRRGLNMPPPPLNTIRVKTKDNWGERKPDLLSVER